MNTEDLVTKYMGVWEGQGRVARVDDVILDRRLEVRYGNAASAIRVSVHEFKQWAKLWKARRVKT